MWKSIWTLIYLLILGGFANAQSKETYNGPYTINQDSVSGEATYSFYLENGDTIFDGSFEFQRVRLNPLSNGKGEVISKEISGKFEKGKKNGSWAYYNKKLVPGSNLRVFDYDVAYPADGRSIFLNVQFSMDKPQGEWRFLEKIIKNGSVSDTVHFGIMRFKDGQIEGDLELYADDISAKGLVNNGLFHKDWLFTAENDSLKIKEHRIYDDGWLKHLSFEINENTYTIELKKYTDKDSLAVLDTLEFNDLYRRVLSLSIRLSDVNNKTQILEVLNTNSSFFINFQKKFIFDNKRRIWKSVSKGADTIKFPTVRLNKYPLDERERDTITWAIGVIDNIGHSIKRFFDNPFVEIGRYTYRDLAFIHSEFILLDSLFLEYKKIKSLLNDEAIVYFPRDTLYTKLLNEVLFPDTISFEFNDKVYFEKLDLPLGLGKNNEQFEDILTHFNDMQSHINLVNKRSDSLLDIVRKESALSELEEELVRKRDSVNILFSKGYEGFNEFHESMAKRVIEFTDLSFKSYVRMDVEEKKEHIDDRIKCFSDLIELYEIISTVPRKLKRMDDEYTRTVWNAYMMVDMDERVKERLYNPVIKIAFPYLLDVISENLYCDKLLVNAKYISVIYNIMLDLREVDTKDFERTLRRERDAQKILQVLGIEDLFFIDEK
ncbi:MAG: hypothetical protein JJU02_12225 [Cryomorphaceae bacterium]|nr:hypothetical protein [Cryomorphaceae bacterium]